MNDSNITDNDDPFGKKIPQNDDPFSPGLSLNIIWTNSEKFNDSESESLQAIHETYPSVNKQSMNHSYFDPSFSKYTSKFKEFLLPQDTLLNFETELNIGRRDLVVKILYNWIPEKSRPVLKTPVITASPFLLEYYRLFPNVYSIEMTKLITIKTQPLKNIDRLPQYTDDNISS